MKFNNPYWSDKLRISALQRWILVHSFLYYEQNTSVVSDKMFDANAYQLVELQKNNPSAAQESDYWYVFNDFDGSTGFDLFSRLKSKDKERLIQIAFSVRKLGGKR